MAKTEPEVTPESQPSSTPEPVTEPIKPIENTVPQSRLNEVIGERNSVREELEKLKTDQKKADEDELTKQEEFEKLATQRGSELGVLKGELETFRADNKARWEAIKKEIPDDKISFFAEGESNDSISSNLRKFDEYVSLGVFEKPNTPGVDGRPPIKSDTSKDGDFGGFKTRVEFAEKDPEGYGKWKKSKEQGLSGKMGEHTIYTNVE